MRRHETQKRKKDLKTMFSSPFFRCDRDLKSAGAAASAEAAASAAETTATAEAASAETAEAAGAGMPMRDAAEKDKRRTAAAA